LNRIQDRSDDRVLEKTTNDVHEEI
jgi:hypothetical protein